ncbi:AAA family ATPase [Candidatus Parvarchaeota archaeon]|nr:AAA family ATPase [Candidatus Parvarchaeota archaeon]
MATNPPYPGQGPLAQGKGFTPSGLKQQPSQKEQSLNSLSLRVKSNVAYLQRDDNIGAAVLVFLGALFLLSGFQFYPIPIVVILSLLCGAIAYRLPPIGTATSIILALPAISYQSPVFGWIYFLIIGICLFQVFTHWNVISILSILVLAPFAPFPFNYLSGFTMLVMAISALRVGSKDSIIVSIPSVLIVLLLSSIWGVQNQAFLPLNVGQYAPQDFFANNHKEQVGLAELLPSAVESIASLFSFDNINFVGPAIGTIIENFFTLLLKDALFVHLLFWVAILFAIGYLPGSSLLWKSKYKQTAAAFFLSLVVVDNFLSYLVFGTEFDYAVLVYVSISIALLGCLEHFGLSISQERKIRRAEKSKEFGKFGVSDMAESQGASSLDDIGGYEDVKEELRNAIMTPLENKELAYQYGLRPPNGLLFFGPPGTGKTMMMRALSKELNFGFYYVKTSNLLSQWYGESEKNISELFVEARKNAPCILFFDEIDSIGKKRGTAQNDEVTQRVLTVFLQELDGFKSKKDVIVIGATNIPNQLDGALLRPGRFDKIIYMPLPDKEARAAIFKVHLKKVPCATDVDFAALAAKTERFSGADIKNICTEAIGLAAKEAGKSKAIVPVSMLHLLRIVGAVRPSVSIDSLEEFDQFRLDFERRSGKLEKKEEKKEDSIKWADVVGLDNVRSALLEAIEIPLLHEDLMKQYKIKPSKGLLLFGPPGCGKTMIIRAAANELKATFLTISGAELAKKGWGNAINVIKETFNRAREQAPSIIFIDEIETLAPSREFSTGGIVGQLLTELDGIKELKNVMLIGATNRPAMLDGAILRPGRFDKIVYIPPPDLPARKKIFELNLAGTGIQATDYAKFATETEGFSGADISSICQKAKMKLVSASIENKKKGVDDRPTLSNSDVFNIILGRRPSITPSMLQEFLAFLKEYGERK